MNGPGRGDSRSWHPPLSLGAAVAMATVMMAACASTISAQMVCDPCTVGMVLDGPWERNTEIRGTFEREILDLMGDDFTIRFPEDKRLIADWSLTAVATAVDTLLGDPDVDLMLTMGPVASTYTARLGVFPKPVLAVFVIDPDVQGIPPATNDAGERVSGVANLNHVIFPSDLEENGLSEDRAVVEAAQRRFRPILLTTATTVAGLLPLWFGGGPMYEPMAIGIISRLIFATLLTLGVVPIFYSLFFRVSFKGFVY